MAASAVRPPPVSFPLLPPAGMGGRQGKPRLDQVPDNNPNVVTSLVAYNDVTVRPRG